MHTWKAAVLPHIGVEMMEETSCEKYLQGFEEEAAWKAVPLLCLFFLCGLYGQWCLCEWYGVEEAAAELSQVVETLN